jgi:hypothetical protein
MQPLCFVLMPFGLKEDDGGRRIDFDAIYRDIIQPAVTAADMEPLRADEEFVGGMIHKPMFERLMLCEYAIADLTTANPNVFYELGIRHGIRPHSTVLVFCKGMRLPFDVAPLRGLPYELGADGRPHAGDADSAVLADRLRACREPVEDSPLFQLISEWPRPDIARLKTDTFRSQVNYSQRFRERLASARQGGIGDVQAVEGELNVTDDDPAIVIDLLLSYRAVRGWEQMVALTARMPAALQRAVLVQEQLGFALNRLGRRDEAERCLTALVDAHGPSSETNGILGRVYKDKWEYEATRGDRLASHGYLRRAIDTYLAGFEWDWRDPYPGINAISLMEQLDPVDQRQRDLLPVVKYAVQRRLATGPDYWDYATLLEVAILERHPEAAERAAADALATVREPWEPETTARNLRLIRQARSLRGEDGSWIASIETSLVTASQK